MWIILIKFFNEREFLCFRIVVLLIINSFEIKDRRNAVFYIVWSYALVYQEKHIISSLKMNRRVWLIELENENTKKYTNTDACLFHTNWYNPY